MLLRGMACLSVTKCHFAFFTSLVLVLGWELRSTGLAVHHGHHWHHGHLRVHLAVGTWSHHSWHSRHTWHTGHAGHHWHSHERVGLSLLSGSGTLSHLLLHGHLLSQHGLVLVVEVLVHGHLLVDQLLLLVEHLLLLLRCKGCSILTIWHLGRSHHGHHWERTGSELGGLSSLGLSCGGSGCCCGCSSGFFLLLLFSFFSCLGLCLFLSLLLCESLLLFESLLLLSLLGGLSSLCCSSDCLLLGLSLLSCCLCGGLCSLCCLLLFSLLLLSQLLLFLLVLIMRLSEQL